MSGRLRVRFAPSPTGTLHIGGVRTALFNWLFARKAGGTFILRIEDTDELRSTPESVRLIVESMRWLGLDWDEGPQAERRGGSAAAAGPGYGPYFQMERHARGDYARAAERLLAEGKAYPCFCTKEELEASRESAQREKRPVLYDRRCRGLGPEERRARAAEGRARSLRLCMPEDGVTVVDDLIRGRVEFDNRLLQDLVIVKSTGGPTYNFACVVDDHAMEISHVIRGEEHLSNTPSQIRLYRAFGWEPPAFAHLSMLLGTDGAKLSKRHGATSVLEYRDKGYLPEALRNYLALLGWSTPESRDLFSPEELARDFDLAGCQKNPATFDEGKLEWMNGEKLRAASPEALLAAALPFLEAAGLGGAPRERLLRLIALEREKFKLLSDVPKRLDFFFSGAEQLAYAPEAVEKVLRKEGVDAVLAALESCLSGLNAWSEPELEKGIRALCEAKTIKTGKAFHPLRVAVSGRTEGPTLFGMLEILGKDETLKRLARARRLLQPA